jgi:putative ABC transport system permease protein
MEAELPGAVNNISYSRNVEMNILAKGEDAVVKFDTNASAGGMGGGMGSGNSYWQEIPDNADFILSLYDLIGEGSRLPAAANEVAIVVDEYNRINKVFFERLGYFEEIDSYKLTDFIGETILKVIPNDSYYNLTDEGLYVAASPSEYNNLYDNDGGIELTITGILRAKESAETVISYLSSGLVYTVALTDYVLDNAHSSSIANAQNDSDTDVITGAPFADDAARTRRLLSLGSDTTATGINIYPKNYESKQEITAYLDAYNAGKPDDEQIIYNDMGEIVANMTDTLINMISYVLIAFTAISLVVSTIMIAIIIYVSVLERTKEIGILRSVGARKKDISRVFNAEAALIGLGAGLLGVGFAYLISIPLNMVIASLAGVSGIAALPILYAVILILGSMGLTLIAGFIPSKMAAKKDPVEALRTD